jgi:large subunit ribosomal protein L3
MNERMGLLGRKLGMMQVFEKDGTVRRCTVIEAGPNVVLVKRTAQPDGYSALQLGFGEKPDRLVKLPQRKAFERAKTTAKRFVREIRVHADTAAKYEVGQSIGPQDVFAPGQKVDVQGKSRGRGFTGVMRRWNFKGSVRTHGSHEYKRHGGSIGQNMTPGRTFPGMGMPGQHGNRKHSVQSLEVVQVIPEENLILIEGGVPGHRNALVIVRQAARGG